MLVNGNIYFKSIKFAVSEFCTGIAVIYSGKLLIFIAITPEMRYTMLAGMQVSTSE